MRSMSNSVVWGLVGVLAVAICLAMVGGGVEAGQVMKAASGDVDGKDTSKGGGEIILFFDNFEDGVPWSTDDLGSIDPVWHPDMYHAWSGKSWWCGEELSQNPVVRGYLDDWYQVLDTPALSFVGYSAPITLTFKSRYKVEPPGAEPPFDGWDGSNVRVSTDGGGSFTVVTPTLWSYTHSSLYSFGEQHCEDAGVPGWCGGNDTWGDASFDLSAYAGMDDVVVRFAFASDPAWCTLTEGDTSAHGWFVDDIVVASGVDTIFSDDGEDTTPLGQMAPRNNYAGGVWGGDLWMKTTVDAHSGMYSWNCDDSLRMNNALISPPIELPTDRDSLGFSYYVYADVPDHDGNGDNALEDYYHLGITTNNGLTWEEIGYDYSYNGSDVGWVERTTALRMPGPATVSLDLLPYAGQTIRLRWRLVTDCNDDGGNGTGLYIDDVKVYAKVNLPYTTRLRAYEPEDSLGNIQVEWGMGGELAYDDGSYETTWYGSQGGRYWAVRVDGQGGVSRRVDMVKFRVTPAETVDVCGWEDTGPVVQGHRMPSQTPLYLASGVMPEANGWTTVDVSGLDWVFDGDFYVGYLQKVGYKPRCCLDTNDVKDHRSVLFQPGWGWDTWTNISGEIIPNANFLIRAVLGDVEGVVGYNLYRRLESDLLYGDPLAAWLPPAQNSYVDETVELAVTYCYTVTALIEFGNDTLESSWRLEACTTATEGAVEVLYDDGSAEGGFTVGAGASLAMKFSPPVHPVTVARIGFYPTGSGAIIPKVWADDGGEPSAELYSGDPDTVVADVWNWISIDEVDIESGDFYVGLEEMAGSPPLGYDEDDPDNNLAWYRYPGFGWDLLSNLGLNYDLMIRILAKGWPSDVVDESISQQVPHRYQLCQNYPNPFNPTTQIVYEVPRAGLIQLDVYNVLGQQVRNLVRHEQMPGVHRAVWDGRDDAGRDVASGIYLYRLRAGDEALTRRMILLR